MNKMQCDELISLKTWSILITFYLFYPVMCIQSNGSTTVMSAVAVDNLNEYCWNDTDACSIIGNFTRKQIGLSIAVNINCLQARNDSQVNPAVLESHKASLRRRFHNIEIIHLNGCGVNDLMRNSFGIEHIPDQENVLQLTLEMFKIDREINSGAFKTFKKLEALTLINNLLLSGINRTTLGSLVELRNLVLENNRLAALDEKAFADFAPTLTHLTLRESALQLKRIAPLHNVTHVDVVVKELNWSDLFKSMKMVKSIRISQTHIVDTIENVQSNFEHLVELHLVYNNLTDIPINQYPNLVQLNLSHNLMQSPSFDKLNMVKLNIADVSYNNLTTIDEYMLATLLHLETFIANHNRITVIKRKAFNRNLYLRHIDISHNQLKVLNLDLAIFVMASQLQIMIDDNPWSCVWVINFSANEPIIFNMKFVYTKYNDRINMHGLKCQFYANDEMVLQHHYHLLDDTHLHHNHTSSMPMLPASPPIEIKRRNTKHTAMITIIILVVGVTTLLLVLYVHIKCRPMASTLQSPFYRALPTNHCSHSDRADIVRRILPPTDYESPLSERMKNRSMESINEMKPDTSHMFTDIDLKDLYEEIPERQEETVDSMHLDLDLDLDDFSYRLTNATTNSIDD